MTTISDLQARAAQIAFIAAKQEIDHLLAHLSTISDDHLGATPDAVNWSHVGSANEVVRMLREVVEFATPAR